MSVRIRRLILIAATCGALGVGAMWATTIKRHSSPPVSISFQGYSGDCAVFSITNNDVCDISFGSWFVIYDDLSSEEQASCSVSRARLKRGASCTAKIRVGLTSAGWRVRTLMERHTPKRWLSDTVSGVPFCHSIGVRLVEPPPYLVSPHITR